ncbi:hypothetical protein Fcan01_19856 [Folsomia candida]|uniref:Uncharacterized protein n=1 Tax=Folsomia candida TaxID=158441 RepID=A0A226DIL8_FOLCA|nr:hypothetical protein Fcan01_19856 [Folsomia candida]
MHSCRKIEKCLVQNCNKSSRNSPVLSQFQYNFNKMFAQYIFIAVLLVAGFQATPMTPEEKLFFANIPLGGNQNFNLVPLSCRLWGIFCPPGYTGPGVVTTTTTARTNSTTG